MASHSRRNIIKGALAATLPFSLGLSATSNLLPRSTDHFFVILNIWGGLDVSLSLDPWLESELPDAKDFFVEYRPEDLIELSTGVKVGPAFAPMKEHAQDLSIVNGVFMAENDIGHESLRDYMINGCLQEKFSPVSIEFASQNHQNVFGSIIDSNRYYIGNHLVTSIKDLKSLASSDKELVELAQLVGANDNTSFARSLKNVFNAKPRIDEFIKLKKELSSNNPTHEAEVLAAAFLSQSTNSAIIDFQNFDLGTYNLDTHSKHEKIHLSRQTRAWEIVNTFFNTFKKIPFGTGGASLFDHTTFMISNEFARTPFLNMQKGKDHNPLTNSIVLAGKGVNGGRVIGGSKLVTRDQSPSGESYKIALPINYSTGETIYKRDDSCQMIFPENIVASLYQLLGISAEAHPTIKRGTQIIEHLLI